MVGHSPAVPSSLEHQTKLLADPRLALELGEGAGAKHRFGCPLVRLGIGTY
jgi:hypothetical protein